MKIRLAENEADLEAVRTLCRDYRALLLARWPDFTGFWDRYYDEDSYEDLLSRLAG